MEKTDNNSALLVIGIMELLSSSSNGYTLAEIVEHTASDEAMVTTILDTLCNHKYVSLDKAGRFYKIGIRAFILGSTFLKNTGVMPLIRQIMNSVVDEIDETCQFGILGTGDVIYLLRVESTHPVRYCSLEGRRLPAYCTAIGKAMLLDCPIDDLKKMFHDNMRALTPHTITDFDTLYHTIQTYKDTGYTLDLEENTKDKICIGVPLKSNGSIIAGLSVTVPKIRLTDQKKSAILNIMFQAQQEIEGLFEELKVTKDDFGSPFA